MTFSILRSATFAAAISFAGTASFAQEVLGTIDASLDGVERTWFLTLEDTDSQTFGMTMSIANLQSFSLWGQPDAETVSTFDDTLLLSFDIMTVAEQVMVANVSVTYLVDGWTVGWMADEAEAVEFTLTTLEQTDEGIVLVGSFEATANYSEQLSAREMDMSRVMQINGSFTATLPPFLIEEH